MKFYRTLSLVFVASFLLPAEVFAGMEEQKIKYCNAMEAINAVYETAGKEEILEYAEKVYAAAEKGFWEKSEERYEAANYMGGAHWALDHVEEAEKYYREAMDIAKTFKNEKSYRVIGPLLSLNIMYTEEDKAVSVMEENQGYFEVFIGSTGSTGRVWRQVVTGKIAFSRCEYSEAITYYEKAKNTFKNVHSPINDLTVWIDYLIAKAYLAQKNYKTSEEILSAVISKLKGKVRDRYDIMLSSRIFLVEIYEKTGKTDKATEHCLAIARANPTKVEMALTKVSLPYLGETVKDLCSAGTGLNTK